LDIFIDAMNKQIEVNIGAALEAEAVQILREVPELRVTVAKRRGFQSDGIVRYGDKEVPIAIEVKSRVSSAGAHHIIHQAQHLDMPMVVVAAEMTGKAREILADAGIGSVDGLGNLQLELPGLLMRVAGTKSARRPSVPIRLSGKSSLVVQAMLLDVERFWQIPDLVQRCGVSVGLVHKVLRRLEDEEVIEAKGAGPKKTRMLTNPGALLDLWAEEHHDRPKRRLTYMFAPTLDQLIDGLCGGLDSAAVEYALTGPAAAARVAPFISNLLVAEVWVASTVDIRDVCTRIDAMPVDSGPNVVFLQERNDAPLAFRTRTNNLWTTNLFRLYVDLLRNPQRGQEQAEHLRREAIGF
jgi:predicted transcriptional regulator